MPKPACERIAKTQMQIAGPIGNYIQGVTENWLKVAPKSNSGMLEMFRDRDAAPLRQMVPWAGEFAGKYLTGAVEVLRVTGDAEPGLHSSAPGQAEWQRRSSRPTWGRSIRGPNWRRRCGQTAWVGPSRRRWPRRSLADWWRAR